MYKEGNLVFTPDGNSLLSPVGNRVSVFDLVNHKSYTLPFETRKNITRLAVAPDGVLLLCVAIDGQALLINLPRATLLHHFNFKATVRDLKFSPCGRFFAVTHNKQVHVWCTPGRHKTFAPFVLYRRYTGHYDDVTCIEWSHDSRFFATGSRDTTCRVYSLDPIEGYRPVALTAHRDRIVGVFFKHQSLDLYTVSKDGTVLHWHAYQRELDVTDLQLESSGMDTSSDESTSDREEKTAETDAEDTRTCPLAKRRKIVLRYRWGIQQADKHYFLQENHAKVGCGSCC